MLTVHHAYRVSPGELSALAALSVAAGLLMFVVIAVCSAMLG